jgi:hypothetical protein
VKKIEEILIRCIDDIKAGRASLADCLERYSDMRRELEPLLRIALNIQAPSYIKPSNDFKVRARVNLMEPIHASQSKKRVRETYPTSVRYGWFNGWARAAAIIVAAILIISAAGTGTAYASQSSLPGDTLYNVKLGAEQLQRIFTLDDAAQVELELKFASTRLDELEKIIGAPAGQTAMNSGSSSGRVLAMSVIGLIPDEPEKSYITQSERISISVRGYERNLSLAINKAANIVNGGKLLEKVALAILNHLERLDKIEDKSSEADRAHITDVRELAISGHMSTLQNLAKVNPVRAKEINLQMIQGRLNRAETEAARGHGKRVEEALQEYERLRRFGEEISSSAKSEGHDNRAVDEMNARATAGQLEALGSIYEQ